MKKFLAVFLFLLPLSVFAEETLSVNSVNEPEWKDFAPKAYVDVKEAKGVGKLNETAKYWYKRRAAFEKAIESCREFSDNDMRFSCYQKVKVQQYQENSNYNAKLDAMEQARKYPQEMYDRTNSMLPINNYINTFSRFQPNELRGY